VGDLAVIGNDLYVGGSFNAVTNSNDTKLFTDCIAKWNTQTGVWGALGAVGAANGNNGVGGDVLALAVNGTDLYVGGTFTQAINSASNKVITNHVAKWNGTTWSVTGGTASANGTGVNGTVTELAFSNGSLYVSGDFSSAFVNGSTVGANRIARWTGSAWAAFGTGSGATGNGLNEEATAITVVGNMVYVGGGFTTAYNSSGNQVTANGIARWDGTLWTTLGTTAVKTLSTVSAASFSAGELCAESIVAAFGTGLATTTQIASSLPLPTSLAGTTVSVRDSAGATRQSQLFFVSPGQVNFLIPAGTAAGLATVTLTSGDGSLSGGNITIAGVAPGVFAMNANGQGVVAAVALRVRGTAQTYEAIARYDSATSRWVSTPIDLGPTTDQVFLIFYGSGFRGRSSLANVLARFAGVSGEVSFAGAQGNLVGLDQCNVKIPRTLIGRGEIDLALTVDGKNANVVRVNIR
jgi:uncharacterized protein (TIGR03437 family)